MLVIYILYVCRFIKILAHRGAPFTLQESPRSPTSNQFAIITLEEIFKPEVNNLKISTELGYAIINNATTYV